MRRLLSSTRYVSGITLADNLYNYSHNCNQNTRNQSIFNQDYPKLDTKKSIQDRNRRFSNQVRIGSKSCFVLFVDKSGDGSCEV
jgi:hypothetical protein